MTVLITGAAGRIGSHLLRTLPEYGWQVRGIDRTAAEGVTVGDLASPTDLDAVFDGVDAVVHMAGVRSATPWPLMRHTNIEGVYQVFAAARRHGAQRVIYASSNHVTGYSPSVDHMPADAPVRPDTIYGVTKAFAEALGQFYVDRYKLRVACLRIGTYAEQPPDQRALATWLSPADCTRLVDACLRSPDLTFAQVWGVSANSRSRWSSEAGEKLGYHAQDNAEEFAAQLTDAEPDPFPDHVGGPYLLPDFGIDELSAKWQAQQSQ